MSRPRSAFTLIELLVVIAVIVILLSILLPSLREAKLQAKFTVCQANLHGWGRAAHMHSSERNGYYPVAYISDWGGSFSYPININDGVDGDSGPSDKDSASEQRWRRYGTTWTMFNRYGVVERMATCPTRDAPVRGGFYSSQNWGWVYAQHYMYVGGLCVPKFQGAPAQSSYQFDDLPPAVNSNTDGKPAGMILAADEVYWGGAGAWGDAYRINHPRRDNAKMPQLQHTLFGDGHVETRMGSVYFKAPLDWVNYSFKHAGNGALFYWHSF